MAVIDFHSHILPGVDDGSRNLDVSCEMCDMSRSQGVDVMAATSHFYAYQDRVDDFLSRRQKGYDQLRAEAEKRGLTLRLGAEVAFFPGIQRADRLSDLVIEGTNILLIEMPFEPWTSAYLREIESLACGPEFQVMIAHLERFMHIPGNRPAIRSLLEMPVYVQINAESLLDRRERRRLVGMFRKGEAHFLGTDSHGVHHRPPNLSEGREILKKELGQDFLDRMDEAGTRLLHLS